MKFQRELSWDMWPEIRDLLRLHWREIAAYRDIALNVDEDQYDLLERLGILRVFTARDDDQQIIGYAVFFVRHNLHYRDSLQAVQDVLFIHPDHRRGWLGFRFIRWCDQRLRDEGVQVVYHHVKTKHNFGPVLKRLGYEPIDIIYGRRLDHGSNRSDRIGGRSRRSVRGQENGAEAPGAGDRSSPGTGRRAEAGSSRESRAGGAAGSEAPAYQDA